MSCPSRTWSVALVGLMVAAASFAAGVYYGDRHRRSSMTLGDESRVAHPVSANPVDPQAPESLRAPASPKGDLTPEPADPNEPPQGGQFDSWRDLTERKLILSSLSVPGYFIGGVPSDKDLNRNPHRVDRVFSIRRSDEKSQKCKLVLTPLDWHGAQARKADIPSMLPAPREIEFDKGVNGAVFGSSIYVIVEGREVRKFDSDLNARWIPNAQKLPDEKDRAGNTKWRLADVLHADETTVYVEGHPSSLQSSPRRIYKLDANNGTLQGHIEYPSANDRLPGVFDTSNDRFYLIGHETIDCIQLGDGKALWTVKVQGLRYDSLPIAANGGLLVAAADKIVWYDSEGHEGWARAAHPERGTLIAASADGFVYGIYNEPVLSNSKRWLCAINVATGRTVWRTRVEMPFIDVDRIVSAGGSLFLYASRNPTQGWIYRLHRATGVACWKARMPEHESVLEPVRLMFPTATWGISRLPIQGGDRFRLVALSGL